GFAAVYRSTATFDALIGGWPTLSLISTPGGAPSLSRFLGHGAGFDSLHGREQRLRQAHVDLFILPLELKPHRLKPRKIEVRQVLGQKRLGLPIGFQAGHFLFHKLLSYFCAPRACSSAKRMK